MCHSQPQIAAAVTSAFQQLYNQLQVEAVRIKTEVGLKREELLLVTATRAHMLYGRKKVIFLKENFFLLYVFNMRAGVWLWLKTIFIHHRNDHQCQTTLNPENMSSEEDQPLVTFHFF